MFGDEHKNNETTCNKPRIVLGNNHVVSGKIRWRQGFFKCPVEHVEIYRNDQTPTYNPECKIERRNKKPTDACHTQQHPIRPGDES